MENVLGDFYKGRFRREFLIHFPSLMSQNELVSEIRAQGVLPTDYHANINFQKYKPFERRVYRYSNTDKDHSLVLDHSNLLISATLYHIRHRKVLKRWKINALGLLMEEIRQISCQAGRSRSHVGEYQKICGLSYEPASKRIIFINTIGRLNYLVSYSLDIGQSGERSVLFKEFSRNLSKLIFEIKGEKNQSNEFFIQKNLKKGVFLVDSSTFDLISPVLRCDDCFFKSYCTRPKIAFFGGNRFLIVGSDRFNLLKLQDDGRERKLQLLQRYSYQFGLFSDRASKSITVHDLVVWSHEINEFFFMRRSIRDIKGGNQEFENLRRAGKGVYEPKFGSKEDRLSNLKSISLETYFEYSMVLGHTENFDFSRFGDSSYLLSALRRVKSEKGRVENYLLMLEMDAKSLEVTGQLSLPCSAQFTMYEDIFVDFVKRDQEIHVYQVRQLKSRGNQTFAKPGLLVRKWIRFKPTSTRSKLRMLKLTIKMEKLPKGQKRQRKGVGCSEKLQEGVAKFFKGSLLNFEKILILFRDFVISSKQARAGFELF